MIRNINVTTINRTISSITFGHRPDGIHSETTGVFVTPLKPANETRIQGGNSRGQAPAPASEGTHAIAEKTVPASSPRRTPRRVTNSKKPWWETTNTTETTPASRKPRLKGRITKRILHSSTSEDLADPESLIPSHSSDKNSSSDSDTSSNNDDSKSGCHDDSDVEPKTSEEYVVYTGPPYNTPLPHHHTERPRPQRVVGHTISDSGEIILTIKWMNWGEKYNTDEKLADFRQDPNKPYTVVEEYVRAHNLDNTRTTVHDANHKRKKTCGNKSK
jgi:hypothetical protein